MIECGVVEEQHISSGHPRPHPWGAGPQRLQIFFGLLLSPKRFDLKRQKLVWYHMWGGVACFNNARLLGVGPQRLLPPKDLLHARTQYEKQQPNFHGDQTRCEGNFLHARWTTNDDARSVCCS